MPDVKIAAPVFHSGPRFSFDALRDAVEALTEIKESVHAARSLMTMNLLSIEASEEALENPDPEKGHNFAALGIELRMRAGKLKNNADNLYCAS
jgi:hypothetical protein